VVVLKSHVRQPERSEEIWKPESSLDILIVMLYAKGVEGRIGEPIEGITRLDKIMFLLSETEEFRETVNKGYEFEAYNFGPFAPEIFDDIAALKQEGIIEAVSSREPKNKIETIDEQTMEQPLNEDIEIEDDHATRRERKDISWKNYSVERYELTDLGLRIGSFLFNGLSEGQRTKLESTKKAFQKMSLKNLLHYVYAKYPEMTKRSKIRRKVLF